MTAASTTLTRQDVLAKLQALADDLLDEESPELSEDYTVGDGSLDSLDLIEIIMGVEEDYGITIDGADVQGVRVTSALIDVILERVIGSDA